MNADVSRADLELVAEHGSTPLHRALAIVQLAERDDREDELRALLDKADNQN